MDMTLGDTQLIIEECKRQGVLRNQVAYILATAKWETAHTIKPVREAFWLSEAWRKKNLRYYPYYGRGYVQLTWDYNYLKAGRVLGLPLVDQPDLAMQTSAAVRVLVSGMIEGWFTGRRLDHYVDLHRSDFIGARGVVNGTDKADQIAAIASEYDAALLADGYGVDVAPVAVSGLARLLRAISGVKA